MGKLGAVKDIGGCYMYICPICNQIDAKTIDCSHCGSLMEDRGRIMDYFDDYSAYLDIDGMKLFNGIEHDERDHKCPHIYYCTSCYHNMVLLVDEVNM